MKRAKERKAPHTFTVGNVVVYSWGYEQTNIDFFEVVKTTEHFIWLRARAARGETTGFMCGNTSASEDYLSDKIEKHGASGNSINMEFGSAHKWDGKPKHNSWYA